MLFSQISCWTESGRWEWSFTSAMDVSSCLSSVLEQWRVNITLESEILWGEWQGLSDLSTVWLLTAAEKMDKIHFVVLHGLQPTRLLCPWDSLGKDAGIGCHSLLQGIFPTQGLNPSLLHYRWIFFTWSTMGDHIGALCRSDIVKKHLNALWMKYFYLFSVSSRNADDTFSVFTKY